MTTRSRASLPIPTSALGFIERFQAITTMSDIEVVMMATVMLMAMLMLMLMANDSTPPNQSLVLAELLQLLLHRRKVCQILEHPQAPLHLPLRPHRHPRRSHYQTSRSNILTIVMCRRVILARYRSSTVPRSRPRPRPPHQRIRSLLARSNQRAAPLPPRPRRRHPLQYT